MRERPYQKREWLFSRIDNDINSHISRDCKSQVKIWQQWFLERALFLTCSVSPTLMWGESKKKRRRQKETDTDSKIERRASWCLFI
jgi:hypothetical protein